MSITNTQIWVLTSDGQAPAINTSNFSQTLVSTTTNDDGYIVFEFDSSLSGIADSAFMNCTTITEVVLPSSVYYIANNAFWGCSSLTTLNFDNITEIGDLAFYGCNFSTIELSSSLNAIKQYAFASNSNLETINLPSGLDIWEENIFNGCSSLKTIYCERTTPPSYTANSFAGMSPTGTLYYPSGADYTALIEALGWTGQIIVNATINPRKMRLDFPYTGGSLTIQVDYINAATINEPSCSQSWVSIVSTMTGTTTTDGEPTTQIMYRVTMDETTFTRNTNIVFSCLDDAGNLVEEDKVVLYQAGPVSSVSFTPSIVADASKTTGSFTVTYSGFASSAITEPTPSVSWFTITNCMTMVTDTNTYNCTYSYQIEANTDTESRTGTVVIRVIGLDGVAHNETITISQNGMDVDDDVPHANYMGYFQSLDGVDYTVRLISDVESDDYGLVMLAGESPFTVSYPASDTLFEPVKKSTATIRIVSKSYLEHILSPYAQGTRVELLADNDVKWCGYLTPKIYDQSWVNEYEEIELEASDCISSLQYLDYEPLNDRGFVTFKQILDDIRDKCGQIKGYYWSQSKIVEDEYLTPDKIGIYEQNFFTNDTDEPWKLYDVLYEICQYLGVTCVQCFNSLYLLDYGDYTTQAATNSKYDYYATDGTYGSYWYMGNNAVTISADTFRGNDGTISFQPIYNKVVVKDNMYNVESIFPEIFDDQYLTNINGDFHTAVEVEPLSDYAAYPKGRKYKDEDVADTTYRYFMRIYDHKYWQTIYNGNMTLVGGDAVQLLRNTLQGRIVDLGTVKEAYYSLGQKIVPNTVDYTRYLCIPERHDDAEWNTGKVVFRLKDGWKMPCMVSDDAFLVLSCNAKFERYPGRPYINPDWTSAQSKLATSGNYSTTDRIAAPRFKLTIGDKAWSSFRKRWVELDDTHNYIEPIMEWQQDNIDYWNTDINTLNQVSWEENVNETGYMIPLADVDLSQDIHFEIQCPAPTCYGWSDKESSWFGLKYNAYCWLSELTIKVVERGQDVVKEDNDVIYENVVDEDSLNELDEITFRLTTYNNTTKPSYSNVVYVSTGKTFLTYIKDRGLSSAEQKPEENCIERYVNQYSTPTRQLCITLTDNHNTTTYNGIITPFICQGTGYFPLGIEIDYANSKETITLIEEK